ncbi:MAG: pseudouridine synthase [Haliscomenobacter sp.]|nr:pseudouridine synthase [Haliscomenobacter sp.]MBK8877592.1 pseudouridine synthase [Haliscomenobacter sp.]
MYKPYGVLSQFTPEEPGQQTLGDVYPFPASVYPVGRLDLDSEGLLLLSDDPLLNSRLLDPRRRHERAYWVQVDGIPSPEALDQLRTGVEIRVGKALYRTLPAGAAQLEESPQVSQRIPPIRFRKALPVSWLEIRLVEGKNRQVRKMCAKVGFPVLRLIRVRMEELSLEGLQPGEVREMSKEDAYRQLRIR